MIARTKILEWLSITILIALLVGPIGFLGWLIFFTNTFSVESITIVDSRPHTEDAIREILADTKGQNILFVRTQLFGQRILQAIPQLRDVHITRVLPGTIKIVAQEKTPVLLLFTKGDYYFVDDQGIPFEEASLDKLPGTPLPIVKNSDPNAALKLGIPAVDDTFVDFVLTAQKTLPDIAAQIAEIRIPSLSAREVHFHLINNWIIKLDTTSPLKHQLATLSRVITESLEEQSLSNIEYIDLRIPNRVYYRLR